MNHKLYIFILFLLFGLNAGAQDYLTAISERPVKTSTIINDAPALPDNIEITKVQDRKQLMAYLKKFDVADVNYNQSKIKRLYKLANLFTKLRLYPLAMKCFFKTMQLKKVANDSIPGDLAVSAKDDSTVENQVAFVNKTGDKEIKSKTITCPQIINTFNDGKTAVAYAMVFHVKQPVRGKRKIFKLANTGHTFITLIKYNSDSTYASISFGFYPKKDNPLSATPIIPSTSSIFKDDSEHQWDEVVGKFISKRRFEKILLLTQQYNNISYHLCNNNCTDFGLKAATLAGLSIWDTKGSWPLGSGNNPAITGQSIIEGKFDNADTGDANNLLIELEQ